MPGQAGAEEACALSSRRRSAVQAGRAQRSAFRVGIGGRQSAAEVVTDHLTTGRHITFSWYATASHDGVGFSLWISAAATHGG